MKTTETTTKKTAKKAASTPVQKTVVAKKKTVTKPKAEKLTEVEPSAEIEPEAQNPLPETALTEVEEKLASKLIPKIDRKIVNGVRMPKFESGAAKLWAMLDQLLEDKGRAPARFEFREAISIENENRLAIGVNLIHPDTASVQYFFWRKFYGIKARESGLHPKQNSFEVSTFTPYVKKERKGKETLA